MSVEQKNGSTKSGPSSQGGLLLVLSSGDRNGNSVPCPGSSTPDSLRSLSSLSDGSTTSPPDVDMMEVCLSQGSPLDNPTDTETLAKVHSTFTIRAPEDTVGGEVDVEPVQISNTSLDNRNENITLVIASLQRSHGAPSGRRSTETGDGRSVVASPDPAEERDSLSWSDEASRCGSSENGWCSISLGEMVMRTNSFCLQGDDPPFISQESLPDLGLLSGTQCSGMTFILSDDQIQIPSEDGHMVEPRSQDSVGPPGEGGLMQTFLCDPAPSASGGVSPAPDSMTGSNAELRPYFTTPGGELTFLLSASESEELDASCSVQTSTPVQQLAGNKVFGLPSLDESPFTATPGSPASHPVKDQRGAVTPKRRLVARLPPSTSRISKAEIKTFPRPDFSSVRPKIMSRPVHPLANASSALAKTAPRKPSHVTTPSLLSQVNKNTPMKTALTTSVLGGTPSKAATVDDSQSMAVNAGSLYLGMTFMQSDDQDSPTAESPAAAEEDERSRRASLCDSVPAAFEHTPSAPCRQGGQASSEAEQVASSAGGVTSAQRPTGNQTFCFPSPSEDHADPKPSPVSSLRKEEVLNRNKSPDSACNQKAPVLKPRSSCSSESSSSSKPPRVSPGVCPSTSVSVPTGKADVQLGSSRPGTQARPPQHRQPRQPEARRGTPERTSRQPEARRGTPERTSRQPEARRGTPERTSREIKKISLVTASSKASVAGAASEGSKGRVGLRPALSRTRGTPAPSQAPAARPPPPPTAPRRRLLSSGKDGNSSSSSSPSGAMASPRAKQNSTPEGASVGAFSSTSSIKPLLAGSRPPQTTGRPPAIGPPSALNSRLPYKSLGIPKSTLSKASEHSFSTVNTQVSDVPAQVPRGAPGSSRTTLLRARLPSVFTHPGRNTGPVLATGCKTTAVTNQMAQRSGASPLKRTASSRLARPTAGQLVDKKTSPRTQPPAPAQQQQPQPAPPQSSGPLDPVPAEGRAAGGRQENYRALCERTNQNLQGLRGLLATSHRRFEAVTVVLQQALAERDEAMKQRRELSQELMTLRGELVSSAHSCERLEQEKDEVRVALEGMLLKVQDKHQSDLAQLEERLRAFYQAEWDMVHLTYQEEADRCHALMEQQMVELRANHEALKLELEASHSEQLQAVKQQHQDSLEELRKAHEQEMQMLDKTLKEAEATLSAQIQELSSENTTLNDRLKAEEDRRRELAEKNLKDSHTLYLEQELESLKVVLDIKNKQLHQQERKLMQMDKLVDKSVKLDECLIKVQQENEDLKARMDRHAALSRQLSTEQAVLQETLHKESKVNKRLSMEKEELIWKLHNGDLASPRKMSPTSPSHSLSLQSPRSSALFSSPPISPR